MEDKKTEEAAPDATGASEPQMSLEQVLSVFNERISMLEAHHGTTVELMKTLAGACGLELHKQAMPDGRTMIGWKPKLVVPGNSKIVTFPGKN